MEIKIPRESFFAPIAIMVKNNVPINSIIDIGCADGTFALEFCRVFGKEKNVLNIDAQPIYEPSLRKIQQVTGEFYKITAVSSFNGKINFNINNDDQNFYWGGISKEGNFVECRTLDSLVEEFKLPEPYFIKMDIEGAEFSALQGAVDILDKTAALLLETDIFYGAKSCGNFHDIYSFLAARNFSLFDILSLGHRPTDGALYQIYTVFLNKKYEFRDKTNFTTGETQTNMIAAAMKERRQSMIALNDEILRNW
jgi:FkbM family methyltransferase